MIQRAHLPILLGLIAMVVACGGGGSGGGGGGVVNGGPSSNIVASFTADHPNPTPDDVSMVQQGAAGNLVTVDVRVTDVSGVYGAAFDVIYDPALVSYDSWIPGNLLEQGGQTPNYTVQVSQPGRLVVGASRIGNVSGANAAGTRSLIRLIFSADEVGSSVVQFQVASLIDDQIPPQDIQGTSWFGGFVNGTE